MLSLVVYVGAVLTAAAPAEHSVWQPVERAMIRVPPPSESDLRAARLGTRTWRVRFVGNALQTTSAPSPAPALPFDPEIHTSDTGDPGTMPNEVLHVPGAWFVAYYHGEFGGALWHFNDDGSIGHQLLNAPTYGLLPYGDEVLAETGSAAPFFVKPLRIHRFALHDGQWREVGHVDFSHNIVSLTNARGQFYGITSFNDKTTTLAKVGLSGTLTPLYDFGGDLDIPSVAVAPDGDFGLGADGYVARLHRRGTSFDVAWYAPRDCVRYSPSTDDSQASDARCIGARGVPSYVKRSVAPLSYPATSSDGLWMLDSGGAHLLHFVRDRWVEVPLPDLPHSFFRRIEDLAGAPLVLDIATGTLRLRYGDHWVALGSPNSCNTFLSVTAPMAWCLSPDERTEESKISGIGRDGHETTATVHATVNFLQAGLSNDAWFSEKDTPVLAHVHDTGLVQTLPVSSPVGVISRGGNAVWFSETDQIHYGYVDARDRLHEFAYPKGVPVVEVSGAQRGVWLRELFEPGSIIVRHLGLDGSQTAYVQDVGATDVAPDGTVWAASREFSTIVRVTEDGTMTRYSLPCHGSRLFFMPAPNDGVWFRSTNPQCHGLLDERGIQVRDLPLVQSVVYK